jgi:hypothetical protein
MMNLMGGPAALQAALKTADPSLIHTRGRCNSITVCAFWINTVTAGESPHRQFRC